MCQALFRELDRDGGGDIGVEELVWFIDNTRPDGSRFVPKDVTAARSRRMLGKLASVSAQKKTHWKLSHSFPDNQQPFSPCVHAYTYVCVCARVRVQACMYACMPTCVRAVHERKASLCR